MGESLEPARLRQRIVVLVVTVALLLAGRPARADHDPILGPPDSAAAKTKKVVVIGLYGASLAAFGASLAFLAQASGAESYRKEAIQAAGGPSDGTCTTVAQCEAARTFRTDQESALSRATVGLGVAAGLAVVSTVVLLAWQFPNEKVDAKTSAKLATFTTGSGGGLGLAGRF